MRTREQILSEVIEIYREISERKLQISFLYTEAKQIEDLDDDMNGRNSYLECIKTYAR